MRGFQGNRCLINDPPDFVVELHAFNVLCEIVQSAEQAEGISQRGNGCMTQAGRDAEPGLLTHLDHDPVFDRLDVDGQCGLSAGHCAAAGGDLDSHFVVVPQDLRVHVAAVELRHQGVGDVVWLDISVKNSSVHVFDYNPALLATTVVVVFHV
jgi:hypothetical protein